jgi:hypothetical protein
MAVIPLRIELRYDLDEFRMITDANSAKTTYDRIKSLKRPAVKFTARDSDQEGRRLHPASLRTVFSKAVSSFRSPETRKITPTYIFGPSFNLRTLRVRGTEVNVRSAPAASVAYFGSAEVGSCPFLFASNGVDEPSRIGRVLVGASKSNLIRTEEIKLPKETQSFFISEQEPEVTLLETVMVKGPSPGEEHLIASSVVLHPGEAREFVIPKEIVGDVTLILRGYYEPLRFDNSLDTVSSQKTRAPN